MHHGEYSVDINGFDFVPDLPMHVFIKRNFPLHHQHLHFVKDKRHYSIKQFTFKSKNVHKHMIHFILSRLQQIRLKFY